jgi:hypothetical protein
MKVNYRGFELEAKREKCLAGYALLYYTAYIDGYEYICSFEDSNETTIEKIRQLENMVDDYWYFVENGHCPECGSKLNKKDNDNQKMIYCCDCDFGCSQINA